MCVFMSNFSSKTLKCHILLIIYCKNMCVTYHLLKFTLLWERASTRWLLMRALQKQLQVFTEKIQIRTLLRFTSQYYLPTFHESNTWDFHLMIGISGNVPATSKDFRRLSEDFRTLSKMSAHISKTFEHFRSYLKDENFSVLWFR